MATYEELLPKVQKIIQECLGDDSDKVEKDTKLEDLGADSLDLVEITMEFEEAFDIDIPEQDEGKINVESTVKDVVNYLIKSMEAMQIPS